FDRPLPRLLQRPAPTFEPRRHDTRSSLLHPAAPPLGSLTRQTLHLSTRRFCSDNRDQLCAPVAVGDPADAQISLRRTGLPRLARLPYDCCQDTRVFSAPSITTMPALPANSRWEDHMARFSAIRIPGTSKGLAATPGGAIRVAALATTVLAAAAPSWAAD